MTDTLLIADQDPELCSAIAAELAADGYRTVAASAVRAVAVQLDNHRPALLVLGDFDGPGAAARLLRSLRAGQQPFSPAVSTTPAIVMAQEPGELALLRCFDAGADDFLGKRAPHLEVRARIGAVLARAGGARVSRARRIGQLEVDPDARRAAYAGHDLELCPLEFDLLSRLAGHPQRVFTKAELLHDIWGQSGLGRSRTVDAHACRLRRKLRDAGAAPSELVVNRRGVGYTLTAAGPHGDSAA